MGNENMHRMRCRMTVGNLLQAKRANSEPTKCRSAREQSRTFTPLRVQQSGPLALLAIRTATRDQYYSGKYLRPCTLTRSATCRGTCDTKRTQLGCGHHTILICRESLKAVTPRRSSRNIHRAIVAKRPDYTQ